MEANGKGGLGRRWHRARAQQGRHCPSFQKDVNAPEKPTSRERTIMALRGKVQV